MKTLTLLTLLALAGTGCGEKKEDPSQALPQANIGKISNVEISQEGANQYFVSMSNNQRTIGVQVLARVSSLDANEFIPYSKATQDRIGSIECLEWENSKCMLQQFDLDIVNRGERFRGRFNVANSDKEFSVKYFEQEVDSVGLKVGAALEANFATAGYRKITFGATEVHGFMLGNYTNDVSTANEVYVKRMNHPSKDNVRIIVVGRLPVNSQANGANTLADAIKDGFQSNQAASMGTVHSYKGLSTVFQAKTTKSQIDQLLQSNQRKVGLKIEGLDGLL